MPAMTVRRGPEVMRVRAPYAETRGDIEAISGLVDQAFAIAKARITFKEVGGAIECRCFIPDVIQVRGQAARPLIITARVGLPTETEIGAAVERHYAEKYGAEVGAGKVRKKIKATAKKVATKVKKVAKKVAQSKVVKALKKVAIPLAAIVPGMQPLAAGLAAAAATKKIVQAAKKGHPAAKKGLQKAVRGAKNALASVTQATQLKLATPAEPTDYTVTDADGNEETVTL